MTRKIFPPDFFCLDLDDRKFIDFRFRWIIHPINGKLNRVLLDFKIKNTTIVIYFFDYFIERFVVNFNIFNSFNMQPASNPIILCKSNIIFNIFYVHFRTFHRNYDDIICVTNIRNRSIMKERCVSSNISHYFLPYFFNPTKPIQEDIDVNPHYL